MGWYIPITIPTMASDVEYVYYGQRAAENHDAMIIAEVTASGGMVLCWWTGYVNGTQVKLYPRRYAPGFRDGRDRKPFTMAMKDIKFEKR